LSPYPITFQSGQSDALLKQLHDWRSTHETQQAQRERNRTEKHELEKIIAEKQTQFKERSESHQQMSTRLTQAQAELDQLTQQRIELFGAGKPDEVLAQLEAQRETLQQKLTERTKAQQQTQIQLERSRSQLEQITGQLEALQAKYDKRIARLTSAAEKRGFTSWKLAKDALLDEETEKKIESQLNAIQKQIVQAQQQVKDLQKRLQQIQSETPKSLEEHVLQRQLTEQKNTLTEQIEALAQLKATLVQNEARKKQNEALVQEWNHQQKEVNRWAKLNQLIGSATGHVYRNYAQSLTLRRLIQMANTHLNHLNGRYLIELTREGDLELDIIDTFQADNRRSMSTLSGGEGFLVSLSLALGLSDLAGRNAVIQSLFIDEGFGTLDSHSLDLAISTLENLQALGKTIGIISHVQELKERIGVQIQVQKLGNGVSTLSVEP